MKYGLAALVVLVLALHQDSWNWTDKTLVFGFLPIGLAYHGLYALVAAGTMALLVRFAWPKSLDNPLEERGLAGAGGQSAEEIR